MRAGEIASITKPLVGSRSVGGPASAGSVPGGTPPAPTSGFVTTADGVRIHYLEAQPADTPPAATILFVPAWTLPAWIWQHQLDTLSKRFRVVAMDPRSQGESSQTSEGLYPAARAGDIRAVVAELRLAPVVLVGWSMAVNEVLSYVDRFGTADIAGLVLVDDAGGVETPADAAGALAFIGRVQRDRQGVVPDFIRTVFFKKPQPAGFVDRVIAASMGVPTNTAVSLLVGKFATSNRDVPPRIDRPTLVCAARSEYMGAILAMQARIVGSRLEIFEGDGHALFVDDARTFNSLVEQFVGQLGH